MADRDYERDDAGKFASIGAGGKRIEKNFRAAVQKFVAAKKNPPKAPSEPAPVGKQNPWEAHAKKLGRPYTEGKNDPTYYSFGANPGEIKLQSWHVGGTDDDPRGEKNPLGSHISNIVSGYLPGKSGGDALRAEIADHVSKKLKLDELKAPPGHTIVYRLSSKSDGLANKNAGDLKGTLYFAEDADDRGVGYGDTLTAYAVKLPKTFSDYDYLRGGKK
jgi:hypothetical protein